MYKVGNVLTEKEFNRVPTQFKVYFKPYKENKIKVKGWDSKTTAIHINEFLRQNGAKSLTKKEMELEPTINL